MWEEKSRIKPDEEKKKDEAFGAINQTLVQELNAIVEDKHPEIKQ